MKRPPTIDRVTRPVAFDPPKRVRVFLPGSGRAIRAMFNPSAGAIHGVTSGFRGTCYGRRSKGRLQEAVLRDVIPCCEAANQQGRNETRIRLRTPPRRA